MYHYCNHCWFMYIVHVYTCILLTPFSHCYHHIPHALSNYLEKQKWQTRTIEKLDFTLVHSNDRELIIAPCRLPVQTTQSHSHTCTCTIHSHVKLTCIKAGKQPKGDYRFTKHLACTCYMYNVHVYTLLSLAPCMLMLRFTLLDISANPYPLEPNRVTVTSGKHS